MARKAKIYRGTSLGLGFSLIVNMSEVCLLFAFVHDTYFIVESKAHLKKWVLLYLTSEELNQTNLQKGKKKTSSNRFFEVIELSKILLIFWRSSWLVP